MFGHPDRGALRRSAWRGLAGAAAAALAVGLGLAGATSAQAAPGGVELSSDGVHFGSTLASGSLFGAPLLVPQTGVDGAFWVRNGGATAGYLRISLATESVTDPAVASAMSVRTATSGWPGTAVALSAADPCFVLTQGQVIPAGGSIKVDARLALADLTGTVGQNATAVFTIIVALSDAVTGAIPATECPAAGAAPPTTPNGGGSTSTGGSGGTRVVSFPGTGFSTPVSTPTDGSITVPTTIDPDQPETPVIPGLSPEFAALISNTAILLQELDVIWWLVAIAIGVLLFFWRRRRRDDEESDALVALQASGPRTGSSRSEAPNGEDELR